MLSFPCYNMLKNKDFGSSISCWRRSRRCIPSRSMANRRAELHYSHNGDSVQDHGQPHWSFGSVHDLSKLLFFMPQFQFNHNSGLNRFFFFRVCIPMNLLTPNINLQTIRDLLRSYIVGSKVWWKLRIYPLYWWSLRVWAKVMIWI